MKFAMDTRTIMLLLAIGTLLLLSNSGTVGADGREPALFGRRAMNPNMNSLFFGKRQSVANPWKQRRDYLHEVCKAMLTSCSKYMLQEEAVAQDVPEDN